MKTPYRKPVRSSRGSLRQLNRELDLLYRAARVINSSLEIDEILVFLIEKTRHLLGVVGCSVWLIDPDTEELVCRQAAGRQNEIVLGWRLPIGTGIIGLTAETGAPFLIHDTRKESRHFKKIDKRTGIEIRSIMGVPLKSKDRIIGALQAVDAAPNMFNRRLLKIMTSLAASAGVAITNANLFARAQHEIHIRKEAEKKLREREVELVASSQKLKEINTAMKIVLNKRADDKKRFEESVLMNVRELISPYLNKLIRSELNEYQKMLIEILKNNLKDIVSPFTHRLSLEHLSLTRRELDIANLICQGRRNSEIAQFIGISQRTVETHRRNLRVKLGINNQKINLRVYLMQMQLEPENDNWVSFPTKGLKAIYIK